LGTFPPQAIGIEGAVMADVISITDIRLQELSADQITPSMRRSSVKWYVLRVGVANTSQATVYVSASVRKVQFDAGRHALMVQFTPGDSARRTRMPPQWVTVAVGGKVSLTYRMSSPITFLRDPIQDGRRADIVHLGDDVTTLECSVAYRRDAPPPPADLTDRDAARDAGATVQMVSQNWKLTSEFSGTAKS
jgi:hypothetical protein